MRNAIVSPFGLKCTIIWLLLATVMPCLLGPLAYASTCKRPSPTHSPSPEPYHIWADYQIDQPSRSTSVKLPALRALSTFSRSLGSRPPIVEPSPRRPSWTTSVLRICPRSSILSSTTLLTTFHRRYTTPSSPRSPIASCSCRDYCRSSPPCHPGNLGNGMRRK